MEQNNNNTNGNQNGSENLGQNINSTPNFTLNTAQNGFNNTPNNPQSVNNSLNHNGNNNRQSNLQNGNNRPNGNNNFQNNNFNNKNNYQNSNFNKNNKNNGSTYQSIKQPSENKKSGSGFAKTILVPFVSGVLGAVIVVGTCVGVPGIRNSISSKLVGTSSNSNTSTSTAVLNTQQISLKNYTDTAVAAANKVLPSIVGIKIEFSVNSIFNRGNSSSASAKGSGIIISEDGYILTNNHVVNSSSNSSSFYEVEEASKVTVKLYNDDTEYEAQIIGTDEQTDLAVIKIDKTGLTAAELGDSDGVQVGEFAMAIGNPLGLSSSVTSGIISAVNREVTDEDGNTYVAIQTDASINAGNSGGALVNSQGQVIGVNTLKLSGTGVEGVGFAIPINSTKTISEQLIKYNKVKRPYMGIGGIDLDEQTAKANDLVVGIYVKQLEDFSAAEKGGVKVGDVITEVDGQKVTTMDEVNEIKNKKEIGDTITLKVYRNGGYKDLTLTLQEQP